MELPKNLIDQFVNVANKTQKSSSTSNLYGTIKVIDDRNYVQLDGSDFFTPCDTSVNVKDGERVIVVIKNHIALVTGNMSSPAARTGDVEDAEDSMRNDFADSLNAYDLKVKQMNELAANTLGFYYTEEKADDGSTISYRHNKPKLEDSTVIYKTGIDGFFLSTDGGQSWNTGFDSNGDAVLNILYAIGIRSKWINTRGLTATDNDGNATFEIDEATGGVYIDPKVFLLGDKKIAEVIGDASPTVTVSKKDGKTIITVKDSNGEHTEEILDGAQGTPGAPGKNGETVYWHVKFSDDGGKTFTSNDGETGGSYLGICTDYNKDDPTEVSAYTWVKIKGEDGTALTSTQVWEKLLATNTDFLYKGSDGNLYIKATFIDSGNLCGWIADREKKRLYAKCTGDATDGEIDVLEGGEVILDASKALVKTVAPYTVFGGINYAALYGDTVLAQNAKITNFTKAATFNKRLIAEEQIKNENMPAGSGTNVILTSGGFLKTSSSSFRYKKHKSFMTETDADKLYKLRPVYFEYKEGHLSEDDEDNSRIIPGFYAELVDKYFPEAVVHNSKGQVEDWDARKLIPAMLKLIQLQKEQLDRQEERLSKIESILNIKEE